MCRSSNIGGRTHWWRCSSATRGAAYADIFSAILALASHRRGLLPHLFYRPALFACSRLICTPPAGQYYSAYRGSARQRSVERSVFRWRDLRSSFLAFIPYAVVVAALVGLLLYTYPFGAALFMCYCIYLLYAMWWAYRLCLLNTSK